MAEASATPLLPVVGASASCLLPVTAVWSIPVICDKKYYNDRQEVSCPFAYAGDSIVVEANTLYSIVSKADANAQALALAESQLVCELIPQNPIPAPYGFLYTSTNRLFVLSASAHYAIYEVDSNGRHEVFLDDYSVETMTEASDGNYYFSGKPTGGTNYAVYKLTPAGIVSLLSAVPGHCAGICEGSDGALYTSQVQPNGNGKVYRITKSGVISTYLTPGTSNSTVQYNDHYQISKDIDGKLYISAKDYAIGAFIVVSGLETSIRYDLGATAGGIRNFIFSPDGYIYFVAEQSGNVFRVSKTGVATLITTIPVAHIYGGAFIAEDANGVLYVITTYGNPTSRVFKVTKAGVSTLLGTISESNIYGVTIGFDGDLFIGGYSAANAVYRVNHITGVITTFA